MEKAVARRAADPNFLDLVVTNPTQAGLVFESPPLVHWSERYDPDPRGLPAARHAIAEYYGAALAGDFVLTASTSEAYSFLFKLLADPGDEILVPAPSYPLFEHLTVLEGALPKAYALRYSGGRWSIDFDSVRNLLSPRTRGIVVVHPNNPTGSFLDVNEIETLGRLASDRHIAVIADEVFFDYPEPGLPFSPVRIADAVGEALTFSLGGLSKLCALPQAKLAWIRVSGPEDPKQPALEGLTFIADAYLSVGSAIQESLSSLLGARGIIQERIRERLRRNASVLKDAHLSERTREGGWYAVLELTPPWTDEAFADALLCEGVLVHPGYFYDFEEENLIVASLLTPEAVWHRGIESVARLAARPA